MRLAYDNSVLGKEVWVKCDVEYGNGDMEEKYYRALIMGRIVFFPEDDCERPLACHHKLRFGDGKDVYYDLRELESSGCLAWKIEEEAIPGGSGHVEGAGAEVTVRRPRGGAAAASDETKK